MQAEKKLKGWGELSYIFGTLFIALGTVMMTKSDLGTSMLAATPYLLSLRFSWLSFGMGDYLIQGLLLLLLCAVTHRRRWKDVFSFLSAVIYGYTLDAMMFLLSGLAPVGLAARAICFITGMAFNSFGVAIFFPTYLPLQVYELFVKGFSEHLKRPIPLIKTCFDCSCLATALILSLLFFGRIEAVGPGTLMCAVCSGPLVGVWGRLLNKYVDFSPRSGGLYRYFGIQEEAK